MNILKNFFGRLFYAFTQIIWRIGVFQVNLQLSKLPVPGRLRPGILRPGRLIPGRLSPGRLSPPDWDLGRLRPTKNKLSSTLKEKIKFYFFGNCQDWEKTHGSDCTECVMNFFTLLNLPPFLWFEFYRQTKKGKNTHKRRTKKKKNKKVSLFLFFGTFLEFKRSARLCTGRSRCGYKEEKRGRDQKRDRDTERARNDPKKCANYGLSLPVSIPTPGDSLAQIWLAQWRI